MVMPVARNITRNPPKVRNVVASRELASLPVLRLLSEIRNASACKTKVNPSNDPAE